MNHLLDNYIFSPSLRYEGHKLIYTPENEGPIEFGGMLAASVLCALLSVTDEGETRGIVLDTPEGRNDFFKRYEKEVIADNGGLFTTEVQMLSEAYLEFTGEEGLLLQLCRNDRILDLAVGLMVEYMERLVRERVGEHIYDVAPWTEPFAQWLFNAGYVEARRQYLLSINWTDAPAVYALAEELQKEPSWIASNQSPLFVFDDLSAEQVLNGYWNWLWETVQQEANRYPDAKKRLIEYKQLILQHETNYDDLKPEMKDFTTDQINLFRSWMNQWTDFVKQQIKPEKKITFWTQAVTEEQQEALLDYLKIQEKQPQRYKCLAVAVYSLRQLGYVNYNIAPSSIAKWLSERLMNDYTAKNTRSQFCRAWNELSRYNPAVKDEVAHLAELGVRSISNPGSADH